MLSAPMINASVNSSQGPKSLVNSYELVTVSPQVQGVTPPQLALTETFSNPITPPVMELLEVVSLNSLNPKSPNTATATIRTSATTASPFFPKYILREKESFLVYKHLF